MTYWHWQFCLLVIKACLGAQLSWVFLVSLGHSRPCSQLTVSPGYFAGLSAAFLKHLLMTACLPCLLFMEKEEFPVARDVTFHTSACFTLAKVQRCMVELRFSEWRRCIEQILLLSWLLSPAALAPLLQCRHCRFGKALDCALIWRKEPASGKSLCSSLILKFLTLKSNIPGLF